MRLPRPRLIVGILACLTFVSIQSRSHGQAIDQQLTSGEFAAARSVALRAPERQRDRFLAQLASAQASSGDQVAASQTLRGIDSPEHRQSAMEGAAGGGAFADFGSLMGLIETTVVPDTWEALGGPSTMAPYPQGVYVDPTGTVLQCETIHDLGQFEDVASVLRGSISSGDQSVSWRSPARLRVVSLRRIRDEIDHRRMLGQQIGDDVLHLAGLSRVQYLMIEDDDIILAGPVGGIDRVNGWYRDQATGMTTLRSDFLFACLRSALTNQGFGCTIDPTPEGLGRAAVVARDVQSNKLPVGLAAKQMAEALGLQNVEVFGTAGDTPIGYLMVEADRHMKQLALGKAKMPEGVKNYLDVIDDFIAQGPPNELLLRLWFTASARNVKANPEKTIFEIQGTPIRLSGENQRALANGQRGQVTADPRSEQFVAEFNKNWGEIRNKYPIYSALESVYRVASVSELLDRFAESDRLRHLLDSLAAEDSATYWDLTTPRQVASIATLHNVRHKRSIHHVVLASGGVSVKPSQLVKNRITDYPALRSMSSIGERRPAVVQRWWWDVAAQ